MQVHNNLIFIPTRIHRILNDLQNHYASTCTQRLKNQPSPHQLRRVGMNLAPSESNLITNMEKHMGINES